jgi:hypothetical protein
LRQQWLRADKGRRTVAASAPDRGRQRAEAAPAQIVASQHGEHARSCPRTLDIEGHNTGMRVRRAQDIAARHPGFPHIVDIPAPALDQAQILFSANRFTNRLYAH